MKKMIRIRKTAALLLALVTVLSCLSACGSREETVSFDKVRSSWNSVGFTKELSASTYMGQPVEEAYRLSGEKDGTKGKWYSEIYYFPDEKTAKAAYEKLLGELKNSYKDYSIEDGKFQATSGNTYVCARRQGRAVRYGCTNRKDDLVFPGSNSPTCGELVKDATIGLLLA